MAYWSEQEQTLTATIAYVGPAGSGKTASLQALCSPGKWPGGRGIEEINVEMTGIDRSTLAEMVRRMLEKELISRERTEEDARANSVSITQTGRKALRSARTASDRAERALLDALPASERARFVKSLATIAEAAVQLEQNGENRLRRKVRRRPR